MKKLRVGVIFGGRSGEHEVSVRSARAIIGAMDSRKYDVVPIAITKEGKWLSPAEATRLLPKETLDCGLRERHRLILLTAYCPRLPFF